MKLYYVLKDGQVVATENLIEWGEFMESGERVVAKTDIGLVHISTMFLGLDHSMGGSPLILWKSLVFGGAHDGLMKRYSTREEAQAGHHEIVRWVKITA